jgi:hypothetical protein
LPVPDQIDVYFAEEKPPIKCRSVAEVDATLGRLHRECRPGHPICVNVVVPGHWISIGLGPDPTLVMQSVEPCDGEWYTSVGDESAEGWADFYGCGNHTPFQRRTFVPLDVARQVVREFVEHQQRSRLIRWHDWAGRPA